MDRKWNVVVGVAALALAVPGAMLATGQWGQQREPVLILVGKSQLSPGEQIGLSGQNLEAVTGVSFVDANGRAHPIAFKRETKEVLQITPDQSLPPGEYGVQFMVNERRVATSKNIAILGKGGSALGETVSALKPMTAINQPPDGASVGVSTLVRGTVSTVSIPPERKLWVVVRHGRNLWPQEQVNPSRDGAWSVNVTLGGKNSVGESYVVSLVDVSTAQHQRFLDWFERGTRVGDWPGIDGLKLAEGASNTLSEINLVRQ